MQARDVDLVELSASRVQPLRTRILRPDWDSGRLCTYAEDEVNGTVHFGLVDATGKVCAVVTFLEAECPELTEHEALRLRGMAVAEKMQRKGLGGRLVRGALTRLSITHGAAEIVWCNARLHAVGFYEKHGFQTVGETFDVEGIGPHVVMWREMPQALV